MEKIITTAQIVVSILLIVFILLQQRGTALGAGFGGSGDFYSAKRGFQKKLSLLTVIFASLFVLLALLGLIL
ncbi:MAG: preprotein translocase subunit SecG [Candidatus Paceibacterota bacterium]|nr:preprotein translocase subunit SecG [Candidatus Paceibacterota bacterium]MDD3072665.1 preprotein translocase subunit SecG [Candidatus Paceibacterota bacterium]MDD4201774.1 preprotein translocase subunit SecG [Candidatus Paceibacterota bacterium]